MMIIKRLTFVIFVVCLATAASFSQDTSKKRTKVFTWIYGGTIYGHLTVPEGYKARTENYLEGIVTRLIYADGSSITLQRGGLYQIPMFQGEGFQLIEATTLNQKAIRKGRHKGQSLFWREDNFKPQKIEGRKPKMLEVFPPNIGFQHVPENRAKEFHQALDSFQLSGSPQ